MSNLMTYLPAYYRDITEFVELTGTEDTELQALQVAINQLLDDQFVLTAAEDAIRRRERMLNIVADPSAETLSFRRSRIINRYTTKPPFTERVLQQRLDALVGAGVAAVAVNVQDYTLTVTIGIVDAPSFREIEYTVKTMVPANLVYNQASAISERIELEEHITAAPLERQTVLGNWTLGVTPFAALGTEVVIK